LTLCHHHQAFSLACFGCPQTVVIGGCGFIQEDQPEIFQTGDGSS
jgi:hypothetical protein